MMGPDESWGMVAAARDLPDEGPAGGGLATVFALVTCDVGGAVFDTTLVLVVAGLAGGIFVGVLAVVVVDEIEGAGLALAGAGVAAVFVASAAAGILLSAWGGVTASPLGCLSISHPDRPAITAKVSHGSAEIRMGVRVRCGSGADTSGAGRRALTCVGTDTCVCASSVFTLATGRVRMASRSRRNSAALW